MIGVWKQRRSVTCHLAHKIMVASPMFLLRFRHE